MILSTFYYLFYGFSSDKSATWSDDPVVTFRNSNSKESCARSLKERSRQEMAANYFPQNEGYKFLSFLWLRTTPIWWFLFLLNTTPIILTWYCDILWLWWTWSLLHGHYYWDTFVATAAAGITIIIIIIIIIMRMVRMVRMIIVNVSIIRIRIGRTGACQHDRQSWVLGPFCESQSPKR